MAPRNGSHPTWVLIWSPLHGNMQQFIRERSRCCESIGRAGQNIPRAFGVKQCFNARKEFVFLASDFSSAEVKSMAFLCKDPRMLQAVADGLDFHTFTASAINGIAYEDMRAVLDDDTSPLYKDYKAMRQGAKATCFGIDLRYHTM